MLTARDIMNREVITVTDESTVKELAQILSLHQISGVPVINNNGKMIGVERQDLGQFFHG